MLSMDVVPSLFKLVGWFGQFWCSVLANWVVQKEKPLKRDSSADNAPVLPYNHISKCLCPSVVYKRKKRY